MRPRRRVARAERTPRARRPGRPLGLAGPFSRQLSRVGFSLRAGPLASTRGSVCQESFADWAIRGDMPAGAAVTHLTWVGGGDSKRGGPRQTTKDRRRGVSAFEDEHPGAGNRPSPAVAGWETGS
jgi:hypothetical protein